MTAEQDISTLDQPEPSCLCDWYTEDRGGGYTEFVAEPNPDCREHFPAAHTVTVTVRTEDEGTEDECLTVDSIRFACTAPEDAECRTYPVGCGCESFTFNPDRTEDLEGHKVTSGNKCWLTGWFENDSADYEGEDYDDMHENGVPSIARSGPIKHNWQEDYVAWEWDTK